MGANELSKKLSVILPVYNGEKYLTEAIESVLNQTYSDLELIIIDDGSTDGTADICKKYADNSKVRYFYQSNQGVQHARNKALQLVEGDYVAFIDSDDYSYEKMYEILIREIEKNDADMAACGYTRTSVNDLNADALPEIIISRDKIINAIYSRCAGYLWNKIYKRSCLENLKFDTGVDLGEDGLFNLYAVQNISKVIYLACPMYFYREIPTSMTNTHSRGYDKWENAINSYYRLYVQEKGTYREDYIKTMLVNCIVRGAQACLAQKNSNERLLNLQKIAKEINDVNHLSSKTKIQFNLIRVCPRLYGKIRKIHK